MPAYNASDPSTHNYGTSGVNLQELWSRYLTNRSDPAVLSALGRFYNITPNTQNSESGSAEYDFTPNNRRVGASGSIIIDGKPYFQVGSEDSRNVLDPDKVVHDPEFGDLVSIDNLKPESDTMNNILTAIAFMAVGGAAFAGGALGGEAMGYGTGAATSGTTGAFEGAVATGEAVPGAFEGAVATGEAAPSALTTTGAAGTTTGAVGSTAGTTAGTAGTTAGTTPGIIEGAAGNPFAGAVAEGEVGSSGWWNWYNNLSPGAQRLLASGVTTGVQGLMGASAQRSAQQAAEEREQRQREDQERRHRVAAFGPDSFRPRPGKSLNIPNTGIIGPKMRGA